MIASFQTITNQVLNRFEPLLQKLAKTKELWALEIPGAFAENWQIMETTPSLAHYGQAFFENEDHTFSHISPRISLDDAPGTDINTIMSGHVALNKLDFKALFKK